MTIRLVTNTEGFQNDLADILRLMLPGTQVLYAHAEEAVPPCLFHMHKDLGEHWEETCTYHPAEGPAKTFRWTVRAVRGGLDEKRLLKRAIKQCCYYLLRGATGFHPPWGSLTGIRPTRLYYEALARGMAGDAVPAHLTRLFDLDQDKTRLLTEIIEVQRGLLEEWEDVIDLYVGIPFCTTRCSYCSFSSGEIGDGRLVAPYLAALQQEIEAVSLLVQDKGLTPRALYIGGGTPTALSAPQLDTLLGQLHRHFPSLSEWTVEAGRPDTMDEARLSVLRQYPVTRISVNPQTMNDATLALIGRAHTAAETVRAYALARRMGFDTINMDVIAALPGESLEDFIHTLQTVAVLSPDCLTVHTLAKKRGTRLNEDAAYAVTPPDVASAMVDAAGVCARRMGMSPYYLYRQKHMAGNLENVGYALPGKACRYNIDIMEETTSILALGAGAISKRVFSRELQIKRAPNVANIEAYISRVEQMIARKTALWTEKPNAAAGKHSQCVE